MNYPPHYPPLYHDPRSPWNSIPYYGDATPSYPHFIPLYPVTSPIGSAPVLMNTVYSPQPYIQSPLPPAANYCWPTAANFNLTPFTPLPTPAAVLPTARPKRARIRSTPYPKEKILRRQMRIAASGSTAGEPLVPPSAPAFAQPFDSVNVALRPSDWRADYQPLTRKNQFSRRLSLSIQRNTIGIRPDYKLSPLLEYAVHERHPVAYDIRLDPAEHDIQFLNLPRPPNDLDFLQLATHPPQREMCLWHPRLPWYIFIRESHDNGITIQDVLCQTYAQLSFRIRHRDLYNNVLDSRTREAMATAYTYRCADDAVALCNGVLRMDFLEFDVVFLGLQRSRNGMWEIKTAEAQP